MMNSSVIDNDHWIWTGRVGSSGYGLIRFHTKEVLIHRLSAHLFLGFNLESNLFILHKISCQDKRCWKPDCLYVGTHQNNMDDYKSLNKCLNCNKEYDKIYKSKFGWPTRRVCSSCANKKARDRRKKNI